MICQTCGTQSREGDPVCPCCGERITAAGSPPPVAPSVPPVAPSVPPVAPSVPPVAPSVPPVAPPPPSPHPALTGEERTAQPLTIHPENAVTVARRPPVTSTPSAPPVVLNPFVEEEVENLIRQAHLLIRRGSLPPAREAALRALELDPSSGHAHEILGQLLESEGEDIAAYREYRIARDAPRPSTEADLRLARLALRLSPTTLAMLQPPRAKSEGELPAEVEGKLPAEAKALLAIAAAVRPPPRNRRGTLPAFASLFIPGCGQALNGDNGKALLMFLVWLVCVVILFMLLSNSTHHLHGRGGGFGSSLPYMDPMFLFPAFIMVIVYVVSIADASTAASRSEF
ncbi:MAG: bacterial transcriptional activator domain-containing protein [Armatimonadota bacterium]|nr:bacterial transcriptional activator domain-containing protein [Armatimonadota bacterium]